MSGRFAARLLAAAWLVAPAALAQDVIFFDGDPSEFMEGMVQGDAAPGAEGQPAKPGPRTEKLKKLEFDRRPSAILAAWSKPAGAKKDESGASGGSTTEPTPPKTGAVEGDDAKKLAALGYAVSTGAAATTAPAVITVSGSSIAAVPLAPAVAAPSVPATVTASTPASPPAAAEDPDAAKKLADEAKAKADAEAAAAKAKEEAEKKAAEVKAIDAELEALKRNVTLGEWAAVKTYLAGLAEDEKKAGYDTLLRSLAEGPRQRPNVPPQGQQYIEKNRFSPADLLGLAGAAPLEPSKDNLAHLGAILKQAFDQGHQIGTFLAFVTPRIDEEGFAVNRRRMASILVNSGAAVHMGDFLPSAELAEKDGDREGLNLISRWCLAKYDEEKKVTWLEQAWKATQAVLAVGEVSEEAKSEAITRAVDIAPKIRDELGQAWLDESFTSRPERGMEILAAIGSACSTAISTAPMNLDRRQKLLELQTTAAGALLAAAPELADQWKRELGVLASNWLREAQFTYQNDTSKSLGPQMQRDRYGNFYYYWDDEGNMSYGRGNMPTPIKTADVLEWRPSDTWIARLDDTLQPRLRMIFAQLYLKVGEERDAFPYIEELARTEPKTAKSLVDEFLRVWAKNHDPNGSDSRRSNPYIYMYGFDERANGIPLTRSKQERNLVELGEWIARLRALSVELDQKLVAGAFRSAHSQAEVFKLEQMEAIFGPVSGLDAAMIAELVQTMRLNLVTVWRDPALQKEKKTNRRQKDIEAEVVRGYQLAHQTLERAQAAHPTSWELTLAAASVAHDLNEFENTLKKSANYSERRGAAFADFARAAEQYGHAVKELDAEKETTSVFETWFYAALGAVDLAKVTFETQLVAAEIPKIREALHALPTDRVERHVSMFGNSLTTRIGSASPAIKFRYVREGLAITGETKITREISSLHDYYKDLVTELQLRATIDGGSRVGRGEPFGVAVDLRHTREIEREAGGFSKYLQNQNAMTYSFNYGRPTEDYRDKFEEAARDALKESFEVLSVAFNDPNTTSKADPEYGWRVTPYAYLLLKPKGAEVDRVPPLKLDLDFLDTSGYAVLPIESQPILIDAKDERGEERPYENLALTQTLDERQAKQKKLILEVKATCVGLAPPLEALADLSFDGFDVANVDDRGVSLAKFDEEGRGVVSERLWTVTLAGKEGLASLPTSFTFAAPKVAAEPNERFRFVDADLVAVAETIPLDFSYGETRTTWPWWVAGTLAAAGAGWYALRRSRRPEAAAATGPRIPEPLTPFTILNFMREIEARNGLAPDRQHELLTEMRAIELRYFGTEPPLEQPDLRGIAEKWAARA